MYVDELPDSMIVASTSNNYTLEVALQTILGMAPGFTHLSAIHGAPNTGLILTVGHHVGLTQYSVPASAWEVARTLRRDQHLAKYDPLYFPDAEQGWLVLHARLSQKPAAIVWAAWVQPKGVRMK